MKLLLFGILLEMFVSLIFIKFVVFSETGAYSLAANALAVASRANDMKNIKPATKQFVAELQNTNLEPRLIKKIKRTSFAAEGVLIGLGDDNLQIFEYPDDITAMEKGTAFTEKYLGSTSRNKWKDIMHVYVRGNIVVFYMGKNESILSALNLNKDMSLLVAKGK